MKWINIRIKANNVEVVVVKCEQIAGPLRVSHFIHPVALVQNLVISDHRVAWPKQLAHLELLLLRSERVVVNFIAILRNQVERRDVSCAKLLRVL